MILKRKPTIKSCLALIAVVGVVLALSYTSQNPRESYWAVSFWVGPAVLAHFVRPRKMLFGACVLVNMALVVGTTAAFAFLSPVSHADYLYLASRTEEALTLPASAMRFPLLCVWWELIARSVVSAPIYGLVGAVYGSMCILRSPEGRPVAERPLRDRACAFVRLHSRALLILGPPAAAFMCAEYVLHARRASEMDRLYQRLKLSRSVHGDTVKNLPDVPFHGLRRVLGLDHWFVLTAVGLEGKWTKSDAELLRPFRYLEQVRIADGESAEPLLEVVGGLTRLRALELSGAADAAMKRLENIDNIEFLSLSDTKISDEGFAIICRGQKLQNLILNTIRLKTPTRMKPSRPS